MKNKKKVRIILLVIISLTVSCTSEKIYSDIEIKDKLINNENQIEFVEFFVGEENRLSGSISFNDGSKSEDLLWSSEDNTILDVKEDGLIKALKEGSSKVKIIDKSDKEKVAFIEVIVIPKPEIKETTAKVTSLNKPNEINDVEVLKYKGIITGRVHNLNGEFVENAKVTVSTLNKNLDYENQTQLTKNGLYSIKNIPFNELIEIKVEKEGWTKRVQNIIINDLNNNRFDFGGNDTNNQYAISDSPEISLITINGKKVESKNFSLLKNNTVNLSFIFNEDINEDSFVKNLRLSYQKEDGNKFEFDYLNKLRFNWSGKKRAIVNINLSELNNVFSGDNIELDLSFIEPFYDLAGKKAVKDYYFWFNENNQSDNLKITLKQS